MLLRCCVRIAVSCVIIVRVPLGNYFHYCYSYCPSAVINWKSKTSGFLPYFMQRLHNDLLLLLFLSSSSGSLEDFCLHVDRGYVEIPLRDYS